MEEFHRIRRLPPYVFEEVNKAKANARNAGADIIDLGMGNPDLPAPPHVIEKLKDTLGKPRTDRYSSSRGIPGLRRAQAAYYERRFGVKLNPDTQIVTFDYPHTTLVWEHRFWSKHGVEGSPWGVQLYGEKGMLVLDGKGWRVEGMPVTEKPTDAENAHVRNFLDCIKSGKRPACDIEEGHRSTLLAHLGNISFRVGRPLKFDGKTETIHGDEKANAMLSRQGRKGFEIPEKV